MKEVTKLALTAFMLSALLAVSACSKGNPSATGDDEMKTRCIDGVTYFVFRETVPYKGFGYMSPKFNRQGKVVICDN